MTVLLTQTKFWTTLFLTLITTYTIVLASLTSDPVSQTQTILEKDVNNGVSILNSEGSLILLNKIRKGHSVPPLEYDVVLGQSAAKWAKRVHDKVILLGNLVPLYSHPHIEGENVFVTPGGGVEPEMTAIRHWYCEITRYDFALNTFTFKTAQFSQLVWKRTRRLGLAGIYDPVRNFTVIVARFKPPGNVGFSLSFKENIFPLTKEAQMTEIPSCPQFTPSDSTNLKTTTTEEQVKSDAMTQNWKINVDQNKSDATNVKSGLANSSSITMHKSSDAQSSKFGSGISLLENNSLQSNSTKILKTSSQTKSSQLNSVHVEMGDKNSDKSLPHSSHKIKVGEGSAEMYFIHSLDESPFAKGPLGQVETISNKKQQNMTQIDKGALNKNVTGRILPVQDKNVPQGASAVKVPDGSSEVYAVHRLDDGVNAKGDVDVSEFHRVKATKTLSKDS